MLTTNLQAHSAKNIKICFGRVGLISEALMLESKQEIDQFYSMSAGGKTRHVNQLTWLRFIPAFA